MIINILAGGPAELLPDLTAYSSDSSIWVGVDRGVFSLLSKGIKPEKAFGDFDSVTEEEWNHIQNSVSSLEKFHPEKDETDMELALNWSLEQNPALIRVFGATGGRLDHFFANVQLLIQPILKGISTQIEVIDQKNIIYLKLPGRYEIETIETKKYVSFLPITPEINGLTLVGFKYPLTDRHISLGSTLCISNELIQVYGHFSFNTGILMVVRSSD